MTTAFISYSRADEDLALGLARALRSAGSRIWFDLFDLSDEDLLESQLTRAIEQSSAVVWISRPTTEPSSWVKLEWAHALRAGKPVVSIIVGDSVSNSYTRLRRLVEAPRIFPPNLCLRHVLGQPNLRILLGPELLQPA